MQMLLLGASIFLLLLLTFSSISIDKRISSNIEEEKKTIKDFEKTLEKLQD